MDRTLKNLFLLATGTLLWGGCNSNMLTPRVDEGVIEYALTFPEYDPNGLMAGMLPERTTVTFCDDRQVAELSAGMGVFRTIMVADNPVASGQNGWFSCTVPQFRAPATVTHAR